MEDNFLFFETQVDYLVTASHWTPTSFLLCTDTFASLWSVNKADISDSSPSTIAFPFPLTNTCVSFNSVYLFGLSSDGLFLAVLTLKSGHLMTIPSAERLIGLCPGGSNEALSTYALVYSQTKLSLWDINYPRVDTEIHYEYLFLFF